MWKKFKKRFAPKILYYLVKIIYATNKKIYHHPKDNGETFIISMWHADLMSQPYNYFAFKKDGIVSAMISENRDGEIIAKLVENFNIGAVRGSSSKGGAKALINALKELKAGNEVAITPDGPRGPRYSIADGIVVIAQKSSKKIRCFNAIPTRYWQFNSWDKFILPKPFGTINFYISEAFSVENMEIDEAKTLIKEKMMIHSLD
ncbi:hypothetical protein AAX26_00679 [Aliarcobacter thereius]|uniref:DUF374 domain-containing protein n=2 Tax=Aliarcobacter thereius TaxID=544718 RepID=A0A1C0B8D9_9BACT|nr:lysophospholipid acyltransferase family protein [Aliarcobacter thereius]OCL87591.1 hypothetical protein AAX26_00679 [Aliarcobacter thereius]OCL93835.1 hypothetical protein AAX25_00157 [Aliarcobacter thereius]OCL95243.1 hypothetical protein AA347_00697 [Aliarcobacter thereius LMG 24486]OCL99866.1 hypothetical protein AAX29_00916 [Aliarcobacter thereius]QBF16767.1 lysophospholipid acyltransferase family protein (DUF374 domain) [Aliarcobacter thereius LMG 24486]